MPRKKARIQTPEVVSNENVTYNYENQENNGSELPNMSDIFKEIEDSHAHDRLITQLKMDFYEKLYIDEFSEDFFNCCRFILSIEDRVRSDVPWKFVIKFVIFCINKSDDNESKDKSLKLMKRLIKFITWHHDVLQAHVRFNVVRAIKILLSELNDDVEIPDKFYEIIQDALLKRFWDIKSFIRAEAAQASSRLQSPSDADCTIVISLIHLCKFDGSHTVRLAAMQALAITTKTLPVIIARCRDVNDVVRKKSYDLLIKWKILKPLTVSKRLQIMETGLTDKADIVRHSCAELLKVWYQSSNSDPIALLKRLDVDMEEPSELTLKTLLQNLTETEMTSIVEYLTSKMDENRLVKEEYLNSEMAFFWKHLIQHLNEKSTDNIDKLEKITPTVLDFESYLRKLFCKPMEQAMKQEVNLEESLEYYIILKHLLPIVKFMDIYDEHNRQKMIDMIKWAMSSQYIPFNYVEHLMKLLVHLESSHEKICNLTVEMVNELLYAEFEAVNINVQQSNETIQSSIHDPSIPIIEAINEEEPSQDPTIVNRDAIRRLRLEIAETEVKMNELNESVSNCMQEKMFDRIEFLVADLKKCTDKKQSLINQHDQLTKPINNNRNILIDEPELMERDDDLDDITMGAVIEDANVPTNGNNNKSGNNIKTEKHEVHQWMESGMESKITKANVMTIAMIQQCNLLWTLPPSLRTLFHNVILVSVQHRDLCVRHKAIMSLGLCCLLDKDLAVLYYTVLFKCLNIDHESVKEIAVKSLIDLFIRFGIEPFQEAWMTNNEKYNQQNISTKTEMTDMDSTIKHEDSCISQSPSVPISQDNYNKFTTEFMSPIINLLANSSIDIQSTVAIGLSKLLYNHKLMSSKLLSRLLLLWFNPAIEDNVKLRQYLGSFFTNFSFMSANNQEAIGNCFLITMSTLFRAAATSPLSEVEINNVMAFFERVTDSKYLIENRGATIDVSKLDNPCHDRLAIIISNEILKAPLKTETKYYVPLLTRLRLSPNNIDVLKSLLPNVSTMIQKIKEKKLSQSLDKYYKAISKTLEDLQSNNNDCNVDMNDDVNATLINDAIIANNVSNSDISTPISKPFLLELGSDGKKMNTTYLGGRVNRLHNASILADAVNQMSSMNVCDNIITNDDNNNDNNNNDDDNCSSLIQSQCQDINQESSQLSNNTINNINNATSNHDIIITNMLPPQSSIVFKKPTNVRITRSSTKNLIQSQSANSSTISIDNDVTTNTRITRRTSQRKK